MLAKICLGFLLFFLSINVLANKFKRCGVNQAKDKVVLTQCYCDKSQCASPALRVFQNSYKSKFEFYCVGKSFVKVVVSANPPVTCSATSKGAVVICSNKSSSLQSIAATLTCK